MSHDDTSESLAAGATAGAGDAGAVAGAGDASAAIDAGFWEWNLITGRVWLSPNLRALLGAGSSGFSGTWLDLVNLFHADDRGALQLSLAEAAAGAGLGDVRCRCVRADGTSVALRLRMELRPEAQRRPARLLGWVGFDSGRDAPAAAGRAEAGPAPATAQGAESVTTGPAGIGAQTGGRFFRALVAHLAGALGADLAFLGELVPGSAGRVRTVAAYADGREIPNFEYDIQGTPCAGVLGGRVCTWTQGVRTEFPADLRLVEIGAEAYAGAPLDGTGGAVIGLVAAAWRHALPEPGAVRESLVGFAARAAAELRRERSEERFRELADMLPEVVFETDAEGRVLYVNRRGAGGPGDSGLVLEVGQPLAAAFLPQDRHKARETIEALRGGQPMQSRECLVRRADGGAMHVLARCAPVGRDGRVVGARGVLIDITPFKETEEQLRKLSRAVEQSPATVMITDTSGRIEYVNPRFTEVTGYTAQEVIGHNPRLLNSGRNPPELYRELWETIRSGRDWRGEMCNRRKSGELYWEHVSISPVKSPDGTITHFVGVNEDITLRKRYEEQLLRQAHYDALTGLPNRLLAMDRLGSALNLARRARRHVALLFMDLDHFKHINDTFGHMVGDEVLRHAAARIRGGVRESDTVARLGGDEFLVILPDLADPRRAEAVAEKIITTFHLPFTVDGQEAFSTVSIGIAVFPEDGDTPVLLLQNADTALYRSKGDGRSTCRFYSAELNALAARRLRLETGLRHALERGEIGVHYQLLLDVARSRPVGVEALMRWNSADLGAVGPGEFIGVAEETGLISALGDFVLATACRDIRELNRRLGLDLRVAVNVSVRQLRRSGIVETVARVLRESGLAPGLLEVEITESALADETLGASAVFDALRGMGVRVSVDDFGTGYSSLSYLHRFPITTLKVDRSFIADVHTNRGHATIAKAIISMGLALGLEVIAEGVEDDQHLAFVRQYGCQLAQGYLFCRPVGLAGLEDLLRRWPSPA